LSVEGSDALLEFFHALPEPSVVLGECFDPSLLGGL
jgi:hypothetical protein